MAEELKITQKQLHEYLDLEKKHKEFEKAKKDLRKMLEANLPVEDGLFSASLKTGTRNALNLGQTISYLAKKLKLTDSKAELYVKKYCYKEGPTTSVKVEIKE